MMRFWSLTSILLFAAASIWGQSPGARAFYAPAKGDSGRTIDYEVQPGETLFHIAERFLGTPYAAEALAKQNNIADPLHLKAGSHIRIPAPQASIRCSILRLGADGEPAEYGPSDAMTAGDRFLLRLTSNAPGYLYLFNRDSKGTVTRIFPSGKQPRKIEALSEYMLPARNYFQLDRMRSDEEIWAVLASEPLAELDAALDSGLLDAAKMRRYEAHNTEKGIVISSDDSADEVIGGQGGDDHVLVVHQIKIRRQ
jgi:Domain of unknown function (DUF4384)/LysM domain